MGEYERNINKKFIKNIEDKFLNRADLKKMLSEVLFITEDSVHKRLNGTIPFSLGEAVIIAKKLNISLDGIVSSTSEKSKPFEAKYANLYNPKEIDYAMQMEFLELIRMAKKSNYSEYGIVTNVIPMQFLIKFENIYKLFLLKLANQYYDEEIIKPFSEIILSEKTKKINEYYSEAFENIHYMYYILDELIICYLIQDIKYYYKLRLVNDEDKEILKKEIENLIDYLEILSEKETNPNGNRNQIYLSSLNFETGYSYIQIDDYYLTLMKSFSLNEASSFDKSIFEKTKKWIQLMKKTSTLISGTNEEKRKNFFEDQRKMLKNLLG